MNLNLNLRLNEALSALLPPQTDSPEAEPTDVPPASRKAPDSTASAVHGEPGEPGGPGELGEPGEPGGPAEYARPTAAVSPRTALTVTGGAAALSAALYVYMFSLPKALTGAHGYDDGVLLAASLRLVHGVLPYRDFTFLHPPGLPLLMAPVAALGTVVGQPVALVIARLLTALASVGVVAGGTLLARSRGRTAMIVTGLLLACFPLTYLAGQSLTPEPWTTLCCLIGALAAFESDGTPTRSPRRLRLAGFALGVACTIKLWALLPAVALLFAVRVGRGRRHGDRPERRIGAALLVGAAVPLLPFLLLAPGRLVHDVIATQLVRDSPGTPVGERLRFVVGLGGGPSGLHVSTGVAVGLLLAVALAAGAVHRAGRNTAQDWFLLASAALTVTAVCLSSSFYAHYGYSPGVFLGLLVAALIGRTVRRIDSELVRGGGMAALAILTVLMVPQVCSSVRGYLGGATDPGPRLAAAVKPGSCVLSDDPARLITADRFGAGPACPVLVDPFGSWLADDLAHGPAQSGANPPEAISRVWLESMRQADYLLQVAERSTFVPWTPEVTDYFESHYVLIDDSPGAFLYFHVAQPDQLAGARDALKDLPAHVAAERLVYLGMAAQRGHDADLAAAAYRTAAGIDPADPFPHYDLGTVHQAAGRADEASAEYREALRLDPKMARALYNLGTLAEPTDRAAAAQYYAQARQIDPGLGQAAPDQAAQGAPETVQSQTGH
ncbi:tetratricopeptide repeat protein [Kitasatospora sp. NA04385]|uniref:tetratricopeptide repeat protein n=1 Tax=Kitasatospora sp. NA04385 TaxID=2742135 RepID=UPI0015919FED|nr:tetratricopeptide repeat protein [Kitasatospora sp. NA04385]QKW19447.1 tetratricopeptide repeat protein [Kitasatospora sp. NA04385]